MIKEKKYHIWMDEKNGVIINKTFGDFEEEDAQQLESALSKFMECHTGDILVLNDLTEAGKASSEARKIFANMFNEKRIKRHAFVGMKTMTRVIVSFIMNFSGAKNVQFFNTYEAAINWLKQEE